MMGLTQMPLVRFRGVPLVDDQGFDRWLLHKVTIDCIA
jgi:hypothetical protein